MHLTEKAASRTNIDRIISTIGELPASPAIVTTIINLTSNLNSDVSVLAKHLLSDQVLTAKVLKLSNSSFYGRSKAVSNVNDAIIILGFHTIRSLVLASSVRGLYKNKNSSRVESVLWEHSLSTAIFCRQLALKIRHPLAEEAFISGILHDIGKLIIYRKYSGEYNEVVDKFEAGNSEFSALEERAFAVTHAEVAGSLLMKWNFPEIFVNAVVDHHLWREPEENEKSVPLSWVLNYSSISSSKNGFNFGAPERYEQSWIEANEKFGIPIQEADEMAEKCVELFHQERELYE